MTERPRLVSRSTRAQSERNACCVKRARVYSRVVAPFQRPRLTRRVLYNTHTAHTTHMRALATLTTRPNRIGLRSRQSMCVCVCVNNVFCENWCKPCSYISCAMRDRLAARRDAGVAEIRYHKAFTVLRRPVSGCCGSSHSTPLHSLVDNV